MMASQTTTAWKQRLATLRTSSGEEVRINYIDQPNPSSVDYKGTILLIHGFPQTSYQFRHVIPPLSQVGYRIIAPDYRGAGLSSKPVNGYEKTQCAEDILILIRDHLNIKEKIHIVGHDIGGMIAYAYASRYPEHVRSLIWGECPIPGSKFYEEYKGTPAVFHFVFHQILDLPELLIAGREREYITHFFNKQSYNTAAITPEDVEFYTRAYAQPGAMRAGINIYRALERDAQENREWVREKGKCGVPALSLNGKEFLVAPFAEKMAEEAFEVVRTGVVEEAGHYIAEENPERFVEVVLGFVEEY